MDTYAIVENGAVTNVILWNGNTDSWQPPNGAEAVKLSAPGQAMIGYAYDGTSFSKPPQG